MQARQRLSSRWAKRSAWRENRAVDRRVRSSTERIHVAMRFLLILAAALAFSAQAAYPEKPIRFVIPSAPGGSPDVLMRILLAQMSHQMSVPIVVENKPGASFVLG